MQGVQPKVWNSTLMWGRIPLSFLDEQIELSSKTSALHPAAVPLDGDAASATCPAGSVQCWGRAAGVS